VISIGFAFVYPLREEAFRRGPDRLPGGCVGCGRLWSPDARLRSRERRAPDAV